jgi:hypothetical protein
MLPIFAGNHSPTTHHLLSIFTEFFLVFVSGDLVSFALHPVSHTMAPLTRLMSTPSLTATPLPTPSTPSYVSMSSSLSSHHLRMPSLSSMSGAAGGVRGPLMRPVSIDPRNGSSAPSTPPITSAPTPRWTRPSTLNGLSPASQASPLQSVSQALAHSGFFLASDAVIKTNGLDTHSLIAFKVNTVIYIRRGDYVHVVVISTNSLVVMNWLVSISKVASSRLSLIKLVAYSRYCCGFLLLLILLT